MTSLSTMTNEEFQEKVFKTTLEDFRSDYISQRQAIHKLKGTAYPEVLKRTSFLDDYNPSVNERVFYVLNDLHEVVKCKYCQHKATFINIKEGYRPICSSKECRSKQLAEAHLGNTVVSSNREFKFIKWQNSIEDISQLNDEVIKKNFNFKKFIPLVTNTVVLEYLNNRCSDSESLEETLDRILKGHAEEKPKCPVCGKPVMWIGRKRALYSKYCSCKCTANDSSVVSKRLETDKKKHGGKIGWVVSNSNPKKIEKRMRSYKEKYGSLNPYDSSILRARCEATSIKHWGYPYPMQNPEFAEKIFKKIIENNEDSWGTSKEEKNWRDKLKEIYPDLIWQYMDEKYRFMNPSTKRRFICDFYIPSKDLFIEYQGFFTHGGHPYNEKSTEDKEELKKLFEKAEEIDVKNAQTSHHRNNYRVCINVWTITDPLKRRIAKNLHINYLEIWPTDSFEEIVNKINSF